MKFTRHFGNLAIYAHFNQYTFDVHSYGVCIMRVDTDSRDIFVNTKYLAYSPTTTKHYCKALAKFGINANIKELRAVIKRHIETGAVEQIQGYNILVMR